MNNEPLAFEFPLPGGGQLVLLMDHDAPMWVDAPELCRAAVTRLLPEVNFYKTLPRPWTVTVRLANDETVRALNKEFRGKDKATNVLSFPTDGDGNSLPGLGMATPEEPRHVGDVIIALPTLRQEAETLERPVEQHFVHLTLHGLLHLAGYDHMTPPEAHTMESLETHLLGLLDIPDPYAEGAERTGMGG